MTAFYVQVTLTIIVTVCLVMMQAPLLIAIPLTLLNIFIDYRTYLRCKKYN